MIYLQVAESIVCVVWRVQECVFRQVDLHTHSGMVNEQKQIWGEEEVIRDIQKQRQWKSGWEVLAQVGFN